MAMPPNKPVPNVARLVFNGALHGQSVVNTFHVRRPTGGWPVTSLAAVATLARAAFAARFIPLVTNAYVLSTVTATDLSSDTGEVADATGSTPGTSTGTSLPPNVALCVSWLIGRHYRGGRPRMYFGGLANTRVVTTNARLWQETDRANWQTAAAGFLDDLDDVIVEGEPVAAVAVHRERQRAQLDVPLVSNITAARVDPRVDSQRRRLGPDVS
jgi:hypothetical protein